MTVNEIEALLARLQGQVDALEYQVPSLIRRLLAAEKVVDIAQTILTQCPGCGHYDGQHFEGCALLEWRRLCNEDIDRMAGPDDDDEIDDDELEDELQLDIDLQ